MDSHFPIRFNCHIQRIDSEKLVYVENRWPFAIQKKFTHMPMADTQFGNCALISDVRHSTLRPARTPVYKVTYLFDRYETPPKIPQFECTYKMLLSRRVLEFSKIINEWRINKINSISRIRTSQTPQCDGTILLVTVLLTVLNAMTYLNLDGQLGSRTIGLGLDYRQSKFEIV